MAISRISSGSNAGDSVTLGTHAVGDTILIFAYNDGAATAPTVPSGWLAPTATGTAFATVLSGTRLGWKIAASASETSGTWTNADHLVYIVYRGSAGRIFPSILTVGNATATTRIWNAAAGCYSGLHQDATDNWLVGHIHHRVSDVALNTPPSGLVNIGGYTDGSSYSVAWHDTDATRTTAWTTTTQSGFTSAAYRATLASLTEFDVQSAGGGGGLILPRSMSGGYAS